MPSRFNRVLALTAILFASTSALPAPADEADSEFVMHAECGPQFSNFKQQLIAIEFPERAAALITHEAIDGYALFEGKDALQQESTAVENDMRAYLDLEMPKRIGEPGGLLDIAACWHAMHSRSDYTFPDTRKFMPDLDQGGYGSQSLDWISANWCGRNWSSIQDGLNRHLAKPLRPFLPFGGFCIRPQSMRDK